MSYALHGLVNLTDVCVPRTAIIVSLACLLRSVNFAQHALHYRVTLYHIEIPPHFVSKFDFEMLVLQASTDDMECKILGFFFIQSSEKAIEHMGITQ